MSGAPDGVSAKEASEEKKVWNSLEVWKLVVGALTPLVVAGFGVFLTLGAEQRSESRVIEAEKRAEEREKAAEARAEVREDRAKARDEGFALKAEEREAARAAAALEASQKHALKMAEQAAYRDSQVRSQTSQLQLENRIIERRSRIWDDLGPKLNDIAEFISREGNYRGKSALNIIQTKGEADRLFYNYQPFLSDKFLTAYNDFMEEAFDFKYGSGIDPRVRASPHLRSDPDEARYTIRPGASATKEERASAERVTNAYNKLLEVAGDDLGLSTVTAASKTSTPRR